MIRHKNAIKWGIFAFLTPIILMCSFSLGVFALGLQFEGVIPPLSELSRDPQIFYVSLAILFCLSLPIGIVTAGVFIHMLYRFLDLQDPTNKQKRKPNS